MSTESMEAMHDTAPVYKEPSRADRLGKRMGLGDWAFTGLTQVLLIVWSIIIGATGYCFKKLMASQRDFGGSDE